MKRRDLLKGGLGLAGVVTVTGLGYGERTLAKDHGIAASLSAHGHREDAAPGVPETIFDAFRYHGHDVQLLSSGTTRRARIDGHDLPVHFFSEVDGKYGSHLLPFQDYSDPRDLARALVDNNGILYEF